MSTNESTYILGNGLEGVIAFEKAASENETGSVKIKEITVSPSATVNATDTQVKATITVTEISADIEDGYITRANVTGLNTTKTTEVVLGIDKQTALTQTADDVLPKTVTASAGYYASSVSLTIPSGSITLDTSTNPPEIHINKGYYTTTTSALVTASISISDKSILVTPSATRIATATAGWLHITGASSDAHTASITKAGWASVNDTATATIIANVSGDIDLHAIDNNFRASNIAKDVIVFGIKGTAGDEPPKVTLPTALENTNDATITSIAGSTNQVQVQADVTITPSTDGTVQVIGGPATVKLRVPKYTGATTVTPSTSATTIQIQNKMATNNITVAALPTYDNGHTIVATTTQPSTTLDLTSIFNIADNTRGYMTLNLTTQSKWCDNDTSIQAQLLNAQDDRQTPTAHPTNHLVEVSLANLSLSTFQPGDDYTIRLYWPIRGRIGVNNLGFTVPVYTGESGMTQIEGGDG